MDSRITRLLSPRRLPDDRELAAHPKSQLLRRCFELLEASKAIDASAAAAGDRASTGVPIDGTLPGLANVAAFFVPGRVEVLGKHTDYCGGRSLVCAIDRGFVVVARESTEPGLHVTDAVRGDTCVCGHDASHSIPAGHWSNYPATVLRRLSQNFGPGLKGARIVLASDLPAASGLSSSSALVVAIFLAIASINRLHEQPAFAESVRSLEDLAHYCGCIENGSEFRTLAGAGGVGTSGGSQDHTAILCCREGVLSRYGFSPVTHELDVAFPTQLRMFVLVSGVAAEKTADAKEKFNNTSRKARVLVNVWNGATGQSRPTLASIVRSGPSASERLARMIDSVGSAPFTSQQLRDRLGQFVLESETLIPEATLALASGNIPGFAQAVERSTQAAIDGLGNQIPETIQLTAAALAAGAIAASPFGAGFGGSVWAAVPAIRTAAFKQEIAAAVPQATLLDVSPSAAASPISEA